MINLIQVKVAKKMKIIKKLFAGILFFPIWVMADVNLVCRGKLEHSTDIKLKSYENSILDLKISEDLNVAVVRGNWGCPILAVPETDKSFPCIEIPVQIGMDEISSVRAFQGGKINGSYSFNLNRNSGVLKTSSTSNTTPEAVGYKWILHMITGQFECEVAKRKF